MDAITRSSKKIISSLKSLGDYLSGQVKHNRIVRFTFIAAQLALLLTVIYFAGQTLFEDETLSFDLIKNNLPAVVVSAIAYALFYVVLSIHWVFSLRVASKQSPIKLIDHAKVFAATQPFKYLPTSLFSFSSRAFYTKRLGVSYKTSSFAQAIENTSLIASGASLWLVASAGLWVLLVFAAAGLVAFMAGKGRYAGLFVLSAVAWIVSGLGLLVLAVAMQDAAPSVLDTLSVNASAFIASLFAIFSPGGVGVRELIFSNAGFLATTVIAWRSVGLLIDGLCLAFLPSVKSNK